MIYSVAGKLNDSMPIMRQRPFRELNSTTTPAGILGGGFDPQPGEVSLAHNGILFIDEFLEFGRQRTELLRQPMEEGEIRLIRRGSNLVFPQPFHWQPPPTPAPAAIWATRTTLAPVRAHRLINTAHTFPVRSANASICAWRSGASAMIL